MKIVILGLTITSSWGNGHATTFRSLCRALDERGHEIVFVERDVEWYRSHRDLPAPAYCRVHLYSDWSAETRAAAEQTARMARRRAWLISASGSSAQPDHRRVQCV